MKYILLFHVAVLAFSHLQAQTGKNNRDRIISYKVLDSLTAMDSRNKETTIPYHLPIKAARHFYRHHDGAEDINWHTFRDGLIVRFRENNLDQQTGYDRKGNWLYDLRSYQPNLLPMKIRDQVTSVYYKDYSIYWVDEIFSRQYLIHIIHIEGKKVWLKVAVCEGAMWVLEEYFKA